MTGENVHVVDMTPIKASLGTAGLRTQLAGRATTVSNVSAATGGIGRGKLMERDNK